ncbi:unnamed protein product [Mytilus edulis]|uniref:Reverse transcriptase domain-containing protein n=1 Tax=Mytilus edulis TaxID=6550 RepID=A0A8S3SSC7_MYTED|nr:unnamed protein product [Mytilus edulis]
MNEFSDHMPLFFELNFSTICQKRTNTTTRNYIKWETSKNDEYAQMLQPHRETLLSVVNDITLDVDIHNAVREITRIIYDSAFKVFGHSVSINKNIDRQNRPNNEWFDENCKNARKTFHVTRNFFLRHQTEANRSEYVIARNSYNKVKRKAQYNFKRKKGLELCSIAKTNPKKFWSTLKPKNKSKCVADNEAMFSYFENVLGMNPPELSDTVLDLLNNTYFDGVNIDLLDTDISEDEIIKALKRLKSGKSAGNDEIVGEMFSSCPSFFAPILKTLFNSIFAIGVYPENWTECLVIPVPKSGDLTSPINYRPIILVSILSKLFTSILTDRLLSWSQDENHIIDNQFGFQPGRSTVDAIFTLHGIISHTLKHKLKLYCGFVDFRRAFDKVDRRILIYKLLKSGVSSKFVSMVNSIYSSVRLRVRSGGVLSEAFDNHLGVKQGEPLSPLLFLFFINDIIQDISTDVNEDVISLNGILIYLILFADDTVLFGKTPTVLQHLFDKLLLYCNKWNIEVNADKTKVVVFRNGFRPVDTNFTMITRNCKLLIHMCTLVYYYITTESFYILKNV